MLSIPALAALWKTLLLPLPVVNLTLGRAAILLAAVLLIIDLATDRQARPGIGPRTLWFIGALAALGGWISFSAVFWGCRCASEVAGFTELAAVGVLATVVASRDLRFRPLFAWAGATAGLVAATLALAGSEPLSEGTRNLAAYQGRLAGTFGNANFLGYVIAFTPPVLLTLIPRRSRWIQLPMIFATGVTLIALVLTFSKGAVVAAGAGLLCALVLLAQRPSVRIVVCVAGLAASAAVASLAYPAFREGRQDVTSPAQPVAHDKSGWQGDQQGFIASGPADLSNGPGELTVVTTMSGEGVSRAWGVAHPSSDYRLSFEARAGDGRGTLRFGLEDAERGNNPSSKAERLSRRWRRYELQWHPSAESPKARLYVWQTGALSSFSIRDVTVKDLNTPAVIRPSLALPGPELKEERDLSIRVVGASLAARALAQEPLIGIGWGNFPAYAAQAGPYGAIPTHNEYLRIAAELGVVGLVLLALVAASLVPGLRQLDQKPSRRAEGAALATGVVGMLFLNGLVSPASLPLVMVAAALASSGEKVHPAADRAISDYPALDESGIADTPSSPEAPSA